MNSIEIFLLNLGLPFMVAKFLPYFLLTICGWFLGRQVYRKMLSKTNNRVLLALIFIGFFIQPVLIYFVFSPIYQGDIFDLSYHPKTTSKLYQKQTLAVIALPGCKFCSESTQHMRSIEPYTNTPIEYWVLGSDSLDLKAYQELVGKKIKCRLKSDLKEVLPLTEGSFPTYLLIEKGVIQKAWHNDSFGVRALNELH